jgi:hypothetical protein
MSDGNGFTVKEMLLKIDTKLDTFIEIDKLEKKEIDTRLDILEQHRSSIMSNFRLAAWIIGAVGGIGGILGLIKLIQ